MSDPVVSLTEVDKVYRTDRMETVALNKVSLAIGKGEFVSIMGPSGCGKSTLLNVLGLIDKPTGGEVVFAGDVLTGTSEFDIVKMGIGRTFQNPTVFDDLTVAENVDLAASFRLGLRKLLRAQG